MSWVWVAMAEAKAVDAEGVARRQEHVVEAVAIGGGDDVAAVRPTRGESRVGLAEELVVVVAERSKPGDLDGGVVGGHGRGTPSDAWTRV
jgi:hypothetical protein